MPDRDGYPAGVPCWVDTYHPDPEAAARFYGELFGWEFEDRMPPDLGGSYLVAQLDGRDVGAIGSPPNGAPMPAMWNTYIAVDSVDACGQKVWAAGGRVVAEPLDIADAGRMGVFADPTGAMFFVWQAGSHKGAEVVNAPGSWNWSDLKTRDLGAAKSFYGAVFGWEPNSVSFGEQDTTMWCLPGYAEALERDDPDLRRRHAEAGAPAGFSDAVAWLLPLADGGVPDTVPAHWDVTFSVSDADALAARAAELGGAVVAGPFDAGPTRVAILRDPQGATFTVSRYSPPE